MPNNAVSEFSKCAVCYRREDRQNRLTWQMSRQDVMIESIEDAIGWMERRRRQPSALVLPDDSGEVLAFSVDPYCDDCLDNLLREYEERHTPSDKVTRSEFQRRVRASFADAGWEVYILDLEHLAPRGFPSLALTRDDRLILPSVRGDVTVRPRAFHPPAHRLLMSPEVPVEVSELFLRDSSARRSSETIAFLYMDEKYPDTNAPPEMQVTSLTGLLVASDIFPNFRDGFFKIMPGFEEGAKSFGVEVHASDLFRNRSGEEHFEFYSGLISLINELDCKVYRRGFNFIPGHQLLRKNERNLLGLCFRSMLIAVDDFEDYAQIWPVMETDGSKSQDRNFGGYMRWMDQATAHLQMVGEGVEELIDDDYMVDNSRFGDLHYVTKQSTAGNTVDCLAYLLHCLWLDESGFPTTDYKARLADIAETLRPAITNDYIATFRVEKGARGRSPCN